MPRVKVTDAEAGWTCPVGASVIVDAMTPGPGKLGTMHGCIYVCPDHRSAAEERITAQGWNPEPRPAPYGHRHDPWPCGHITAYDADTPASALAV